MALARDDSIQHTDFQSAGEQRQSPGPLRVSDLTSPRRPHKLEPLQQLQGGSGEGGGATKTKRKKTRIKRQGAVGEMRGDLDGREEASGDPLLDASTLQQMQARLDPLYNPPTNEFEPQKTTTFSSGSESAPIRTVGEGEMSGERGRRGREGGEEGEGRGETGSRKRRRKRRTRRESGSESNDQEPGPSDEQERPGTPLAAATSHSPTPPSQTIPEGSSRVAGSAPHYFPPPEEIQDEEEGGEGGKGGGERVVEGASPVTVSHHLSQSPGLVFVERADGRGFDVRRKSSSVAPASEDTQCLKSMDIPISSELAALYSHHLVQRISVTAHGLVAGLSLWDCVTSNVIGSLPGRHLTLLQSYHLLSLPAHSLYLLLLSLVSLSLLDRLDLARAGRQCCQFSLRSLPGLAVLAATALTGVALILSLSLATTDDRVSLFPDQPSLWPDIVTPHNLTSTNSTLHTLTTHTVSSDTAYLPTSDDPTTPALGAWLGLSAFRSICCVLGWGLLVLASGHDRMEEYISDMLENSVKAQQQSWGPCGAPDTTSQAPGSLQTEPTTTATRPVDLPPA